MKKLTGIRTFRKDAAVEAILAAHPADYKAFMQDNGECSDELYEALFDHFCNNGEMPYGTAKARTGDPYEWIANRIS